MANKKNIKIKRSKGRLYKKKKSGARKVFEVILLVVIAGGLGFLGYSAAGPLISYLQNGADGSSSTTPWEPPESSTPQESDTSDSESEPTTTPQPMSEDTGSYLLPAAALANRTALSQALGMAKSAGCSVIIVPVKDGDGHLLYKTNMESVKDTDLVTGTLSAGEIISAVKGGGFASVKALVPALYDRTTPSYVDDMCYRFKGDGYVWLDAAANKGGKMWVDPFRDGTKQYYAELVKELAEAGFDEVLMSELRFPDFTTYDQSILDGRSFTPTRHTALTALYNTASSAAGSNKAAVAVNIADVLSGYGKSFGGTAEILSDKSFTGTVYLTVELSAFGTSLDTGDKTSITLPADPAQKAKALVSKAAEYIGTNVTIVPVISPLGLSAEALAKCYSALSAS